jgi:hypothetical protein
MSTPVQSLHLQSSMLVFRYLPAPRALRRIMNTLFWPVTKIKKLYVRRQTAPPRQLKLGKRSHLISQSTAGKAEKTVFQVNSELLTKLPFELRQLIWKECLGGMTLHLKIANRRLRSQCCTENVLPDTCWEFFGLQVKDKESKRPNKRQLLSILLTCRQVLIVPILIFSATCANLRPDIRRPTNTCTPKIYSIASSLNPCCTFLESFFHSASLPFGHSTSSGTLKNHHWPESVPKSIFTYVTTRTSGQSCGRISQ